MHRRVFNGVGKGCIVGIPAVAHRRGRKAAVTRRLWHTGSGTQGSGTQAVTPRRWYTSGGAQAVVPRRWYTGGGTKAVTGSGILAAIRRQWHAGVLTHAQQGHKGSGTQAAARRQP